MPSCACMYGFICTDSVNGLNTVGQDNPVHGGPFPTAAVRRPVNKVSRQGREKTFSGCFVA